MRRGLTGVALTALLAAALFPTLGMWSVGFALPTLALIGSQVVLGASAGLLATTPTYRWSALLLGLGVVSIGITNLNTAPFESWGYASMIGFAAQWLPVGFILPVLLTFPGRSLDRLGRLLVSALWGGVIVWRLLVTPTWDPAWDGYHGPARWLTYPGLESRVVSDVLLRIESVTLGVLALVSIVAFIRRWRGAHGLATVPARVVSVAGIGLSLAVPLNGLRWLTSDTVADAAYLVQNALLLLMPVGVLAVSAWSALRRGSLVERLTARAGDARGVQDVLAKELRDPRLRVYFRRRGSWLDVAGLELSPDLSPGLSSALSSGLSGSPVPQANPPYAAELGRHWEFLRRGPGDTSASVPDDVVAAIYLADDARTDPGRVRVALGSATLVLDNTRLAVEREVHLAELTASQSRIVEAGLAERRRLERDLHDGAQQQLLAVSTTLSRARLLSEPDRVREAVDEAQGQLSTALGELRRLAQGIHPGALSQGGLVAGLEPLVRVDPRVRLDLDDTIRGGARFLADVESAAYFVATEGLANAVKHSGATSITITARVQPEPVGLCLAISDDGVGGAAVSGGGLRGLADRVAALGGTLDVSSPVGEGTCISVWLPGAGS